jgi:dTDP-glucose 4,6-dehydratase
MPYSYKIYLRKILITGVARFVGSHLCDRFINEDFLIILY